MDSFRIRHIAPVAARLEALASPADLRAGAVDLAPVAAALGLDLEALADRPDGLAELQARVDELFALPARFQATLGEQGWALHRSMAVAVALGAIESAEAGDLEAAERGLVASYTIDVIEPQLLALRFVPAFHEEHLRVDLALGAYARRDYERCVRTVAGAVDRLAVYVVVGAEEPGELSTALDDVDLRRADRHAAAMLWNRLLAVGDRAWERMESQRAVAGWRN